MTGFHDLSLLIRGSNANFPVRFITCLLVVEYSFLHLEIVATFPSKVCFLSFHYSTGILSSSQICIHCCKICMIRTIEIIQTLRNTHLFKELLRLNCQVLSNSDLTEPCNRKRMRCDMHGIHFIPGGITSSGRNDWGVTPSGGSFHPLTPVRTRTHDRTNLRESRRGWLE